MEHTLKISGVDCNCKNIPDYECPVCKWGAAICKVCSAAEFELLDMPKCLGNKDWRKEE